MSLIEQASLSRTLPHFVNGIRFILFSRLSIEFPRFSKSLLFRDSHISGSTSSSTICREILPEVMYPYMCLRWVETLYYAYTCTCILYICTVRTAIKCFGSDSLGSCEILVNGCTVIVINLGAHKKIQVYLLASLEFTIMNFLLPRSFIMERTPCFDPSSGIRIPYLLYGCPQKFKYSWTIKKIIEDTDLYHFWGHYHV
mgnify:CR=1 FL=1